MKKIIIIITLIACIVANGCLEKITPKMEISPTHIFFNIERNISSFQIFNNGSGFLKWKIIEIPSWVNVSLLSGTLSPHEKIDISIKVNAVELRNGEYKEFLKVTSNGGEATILINASIWHRELIVDSNKEFAYGKIQDAINDAIDGDTIYVRSGIYYENIYINKPIRLIGENKNNTIIDGGFKTNVINVRANRIIISGFTIRNSGEERTCSGSYKGAGIKISGEECIIRDNIIINNMVGISNGFRKFENNQIIGNIIEKNRYGGIEIEGGSGNTIKKNKIAYNRDGIILIDAIPTPFHPSETRENIISNNVIGNNEESNIVLSFAWNNIIENNSFTIADTGIMITYSSHNLMKNNSIKNCDRGIYIAEGSNNNTIYHNKFLDNKENAYDECNNTWDNGKKGNYWSDYHGYDNNNDGIGDIPYHINGGENIDRYPLMNPI